VAGDLAKQVRFHHDEAAVERLGELLETARQSEGKHEPLLQVGRDGVYVQTRPVWEEASCATLAVYDRARRRLGTVYLGQMPESEQTTMTKRLTAVITGTLTSLGGYLPKLRYVTDAGNHPQAYYRDVLEPMRHPLSGEPLDWSWGVDYYHACEYVSKLAGAIFGATEAASDWAKKQRRGPRASQRRPAASSSRPEGDQEGLQLGDELSEEVPRLHGLRPAHRGGRTDRQRHHGGGMQGDLQPTPEAIRNALAARNRTAHRRLENGRSRRPLAFHLAAPSASRRRPSSDNKAPTESMRQRSA
jgi:hypothetical protein